MDKQLNQNRLNESGWARLLEEINKGNVVLVLGKELYTVPLDGKRVLLKKYILQEMVKRLGLEFDESMDFAQLAYEYNMPAWKKIQSEPYYETTQILCSLKQTDYEISPELRELLSIDKFKLVLTTSFDDIALRVMEDHWGKGNVQHLSYEKRSCKQDIENLDKPCFYQMFGKASAVPHEFVLTDDDLLEFVHYWLDENYRPKRLSNLLREKYILVIGCNYPNWLFRFFFHSLKFSSHSSNSGKVGMLADSLLDKGLVDFLSRMNAGIHEDAISFVKELVDRWKKYNREEVKKEIFISYAHEDFEKAQAIASLFQELGVGVWFDKRSLEPGDEYLKEIEKHIQNCSAFIPVLSKATQTGERRFFKREWKWAHDELDLRYPKKFIYPVIIDDVNMEDPAISLFAKLHIINFNDETERINNFKKIVRDIRSTNN